MSEAPERAQLAIIATEAMKICECAPADIEAVAAIFRDYAALEQERVDLRKESEYWMDERQKTYRQLARLREAANRLIGEAVENRAGQWVVDLDSLCVLRALAAEQGEPK